MKKLDETRFEQFLDKKFVLIRTVEMLCEVCRKPLRTREEILRQFRIANREDYENFLNRARIHDRVEVDFENGKIYLYDHDFPGDIHPECIEKL